MNWTLQFGFRSFTNLPSYAVISNNSRLGTLVRLRAREMGSKRVLENSSKSASSSIVPGSKNRKLEGSVGASKLSEEGVVKAREERSAVSEIQAIWGDPCRIEAMTVQQLRAALRRLGVPARGRKSDLVSALRCFLDQEAEEGQRCLQNVSVEVNSENVAEEADHKNSDAALEVSSHQGRKERPKEALVSDKTIKVMTKTATRRQKTSKKNDGDSGVENENLGASAGVDMSVSQPEPWTIFAHKKPQKGWIVYNPKTMRPPTLTRDIGFVKLMSWNVNGLRALLKMEGVAVLQLAKREDFDVLCLQETKLQEKDVEAIRDTLINGYDHSFWTCSVSKLGYAGTAIISRIKPLSVTYGLGSSDHDSEGRLVTAEFSSFYLLSAYVPNSGDGLKRLELEKSKPVILAGDLNCAHEEIDIYNPAGNRRSAGFTGEERQSFEKCYLSRGFVDTFRKQHPGVVGYTYWGYRHGARKTNKGWRLDYFLVSESIADEVHDSYILPDVTGSDHSPIGLVLKL